MKRYIFTLLATLAFCCASAQDKRPDTLWYQYDNRFVGNEVISIVGFDSITFNKTGMKRYRTNAETGKVSALTKLYPTQPGFFYFGTPQRHLVRSSTYSGVDFTKESSQFCFQRSKESEHFVIFWENGMTMTASGNITYGGYTVNVNSMLKQAENIWKVYVENLGFLSPGKSTTDNVKIEMFIVKQAWDGSDWRADGSGTDGKYYTYSGSTKSEKSMKVGVFHCTPRAATARGGHTLAHEIGHTFQYLVGADSNGANGLNYGLGEGRDNEWWEDCANWQAYKVYPERQYSDGEYYEAFLRTHHLNIHHEDIRYNNCFYQDYWCQLHGANTVARIWREAKASLREDPTQAYMRLFGLNEETFGNEMYETFAHLTSMDIEGIHANSQQKIGQEPQRLIEPSEALRDKYLEGDHRYWVVAPAYCPQNYGYNANPLKVPAAGTMVKASFKGLAGADGYAKVRTQYAGWRYGLVAYCEDGTRLYSATGAEKEGEVNLTIPEGCTHLWFVVMGAPTTYWSHSWSNGVDASSFAGNGEQWPYAVKFEGTDAKGVCRTYGEFPEDYERKDTTVVIDATLAYSSSNYSYTTVQYDMNAISEALGLSTAQLKTIKRNDATSNPSDIRFAGMNATGTTLRFTTTTTDSSNSIYGHWFNTSGTVVEWGSSSAIYANFLPASYQCNVGQKPGVLTKGRTYKIRQAIVYTHTDGKMYKAIMEVHLKML